MSSKEEASNHFAGHQDPQHNGDQQTSSGGRQPSVLSSVAAHQNNYTNHNHHAPQQYAGISGSGPSPPGPSLGENRYRASPCPYHDPVLRMEPSNSRQGYGLGPMNRFLNEGPSQQHALFVRPDTGNFSTARGCTCVVMMDEGHYRQR